jgi:hypothetical protein
MDIILKSGFYNTREALKLESARVKSGTINTCFSFKFHNITYAIISPL